MSIRNGELPVDWKSSNITPVHRKGSKCLPSNYRPISLTSIVVKTLERIIHSRIYEYLTSNNLLSPIQHGFRTRHSCQTQLLDTINDWSKVINDGSSTHAVFLDFSKAFDTVPHNRLLLKLENCGIKGHLLKWFEKFLTGRRQRVCINHCVSTWSMVSSGVPQGSILGPLLFIIYINDIGSNLTSKTKLFADDCVLYRKVNTPKDPDILQRDLEKLAQWSNEWQLRFNISKCKVMCISNRKSSPATNYLINNTPLEWVESFKYLGVFIDRRLSWKEQVNYSVSKATKVLNLLRRNLHHSTKQAKAKVYTTLVRPHLEYSVPVWSPHLKSNKAKLENVQKRASRWIEAKWDWTNYTWNKSYDECRKSLSWLTLSDCSDIVNNTSYSLFKLSLRNHLQSEH